MTEPSAWAPFIRIALRYLSGALVTKGMIDAATAEAIVTEPGLVTSLTVGLEAIIGLFLALASEGWYRAARRGGGAT